MPRIHPYRVIAALPEKLEPLRTLAYNLWWTWDHDARALFTRLSRERTPKGRLNPVEVINSLSSDEVKALENDDGFLNELSEVTERYQEYLRTRNWWGRLVNKGELTDFPGSSVAYFSLEFGLHESLPIYSGGLGVLAGDHLKASSDLGVPLVGIGLLYYEGYFSQYLNADGWQQELYPHIDVNRLPIVPVTHPDGRPVSVTVRVENTKVTVRAWKVQVGLVPLYLLDTNVDENDAAHRSITARLYGGDMHMRIKQEIVLAVGGLHLLDALGIQADTFHMNEGHSAFIALEYIRTLVTKKGLSFQEALAAARSASHFTTHTPVPAGNDVFPPELIQQYFGWYAEEIGVEIDELLQLGRIDQHNPHEGFSMTVLAIKTSAGANGVSALHGQVSKKLWHGLWPGLPLEETPIDSLTNGIHLGTWTSRDMAELYERYVGPNWWALAFLSENWRAVSQIPDEELWRVRTRARAVLVSLCRKLVRTQLIRRGAGRLEIENAGTGLSPEALTIGFARRFASYKRATLILHDVERLIRLASDEERPVQFLFAGKAHPADNIGKEMIARLIHSHHRPELAHRFFFLEDYDMGVGAALVQGVDLWLNNPRRPLEASGTSGMKVAANGGLNLSVLDGWWCEAYDGQNGWSIGQGEEYESQEYQDQVESRSLYDLLEREVIPLFYDRNETGIPVEWLRMMRHSISTIVPFFNASRMVAQYAQRSYSPLGAEHRRVVENEFQRAKEYAAQLERFGKNWHKVQILHVETTHEAYVGIGGSVPVRVQLELGALSPEEVSVEVRHGSLDATKQLHEGHIVRLNKVQDTDKGGVYSFEGLLETDRAGMFGFSVRVVPVVLGKAEATLPGLITWWE